MGLHSERLRIDDVWSVEYDPSNNDRPRAWYRYDEWHSVFDEKNASTAMFYKILNDQETVKNLFIAAISSMFSACGNSYINAWLEQWLRATAPWTGYTGPFTGCIVDEIQDVHEWIEKHEGDW